MQPSGGMTDTCNEGIDTMSLSERKPKYTKKPALICIYPECTESTPSCQRRRCDKHARVCVVPGCSRPPKGLYCAMHSNRVRRTGSPGTLESSFTGVYAWYTTPAGYLARTSDGKTLFQHREVMKEHLGRDFYPGENVHHLNGDRADNRIENLELWSTSQPAGQRVEDKIAWAEEFLRTYCPDKLIDS